MQSQWRRMPVFLAALLLASGALGQPARHTIVFVEPASAALDQSLRDALTAQLSGGSTAIVFEHFTQGGVSLQQSMEEAHTLSLAHAASGVFWIDAPPDGDWLLYLADPSGDRTLVRRIPVEANGRDAAVEAAAVITRQASDALIAGGTVGMEPVQPEPSRRSSPAPTPNPEPPRPTVRPPSPRPLFRGWALAFAYEGELPASEIGWQSGIGISGEYRFPVGIYLRAGYAFFRSAEVERSPITLRITRDPIYLEGGYAFGHGRLVPSVGVRATVDVFARHSMSTDGSLLGTPDNTRVMLYLSPCARLDYSLSPEVAAFLDVGVDIATNRFSFVSRVGSQDRPLLEPYVVRPSMQVGLSFWP